MPMGDGTGPFGMGPPMEWNRGWCRGPHGGFSEHGWRGRYRAASPLRGGPPGRFVAPEQSRSADERHDLRRQAEILEAELRWVRARLDELEDDQSAADSTHSTAAP